MHVAAVYSTTCTTVFFILIKTNYMIKFDSYTLEPQLYDPRYQENLYNTLTFLIPLKLLLGGFQR
jgi:hypothetical protein